MLSPASILFLLAPLFAEPPTTGAVAADETPAILEIPWRKGTWIVLRELDQKGWSTSVTMPALVFFTGRGNASARLMEQTTFRDPDVIRAMETFFPVLLDAHPERALVARHRVEALPALIFLTERGEEIARVSGFVSAPALLRLLKEISFLTAKSMPLEDLRRAIAPLLAGR